MAIEFYGADTPNGHKVGIMLEELGVDYTYRYIDLKKNVQKQDWFLKINPNGRIPAIIDHSNEDFSVFESGAILWYLAEKYNKFLPSDPKLKSQVLQWVMFQMSGIGPMFGQAFFFTYNSEKIPFAINRYVNESKRLLAVLESQLKDSKYLVGTEPTIADFCTYPWVKALGRIGISLDDFPATARWATLVGARPAVQKGLTVTAAPTLDGTILVLGASGNNGERVAKGLLDRKQKVVVGLRNTTSATAEEFKKLGAEVRAFDFDKKETHADAFKGIHSVFFLPPFVEDSVTGAKAAVDAAKKAEVKFILNFSAIGADSKSTQHLPREHGTIDDYITESKIAYTHLQPTFFTTNYAWQAQSIKGHGAFYGASGTGRSTIIHPEDIAEVAITILLASSKHHGKSYLLSNNESLSGEDIAITISSVIGKEVKYVDLAPDVHKEALIKNGQPAWAADDLVYLELGKKGGVLLATPFDDARRVLGKPLRTFRQWVEESRWLFEDPKYLVMGATGNTGGRVARKLLEKKARVAVAVRSLTSAGAEEFKKLGAELRVLDLSKKETFAPAFAGIHSVYFLPPVLEDFLTPSKAAIDAAKAAGVKFIVSLSAQAADSKSSVHVVREHGHLDEYVAASGIGYSTLQPTFFASNLLHVAGPIKTAGVLPGAIGDAKHTVIHPDDIADVSVAILLDSSKHRNTTYVLTNKELISNSSVAAVLSEVLGKEVKATDMTIDAFAENMKKAGQPDWLVADLVHFQKIRREGLVATVHDDVEKILGKTRTNRQWIEENKAAFS